MCALAPAHAEKRVALVIGNDRYANLSDREQLRKAVNDARAVGGALKQIGFDVVAGENLGRQAMIDKLDETARRLAPGDTVFFFFAGHGVAVDGINYILPADVPDVERGQVTRLTGAAVREEDVTAALTRGGARVAVVVLDACRDNPFGAGTRGVGGERGLAPHEPPSGVFTFYSASRGQAALDRLSADDPNPNSVFTRVLVPALTRSGIDLPALAVGVREEVARIASTAGHPQRPAYYDETVGGQVYLAGMPRAGGQPASEAAQAWAAVQTSTSLAVLDDYIRQFGDVPIYGLLARTKRQTLAKVLEPLPHTPLEPGVTSLTAAQERGLKPMDTFRECENCPEMVVVPAGSFTMGSPAGESDRSSDEGPQHTVTIGRPFAVGKFHVTRDQFAVFANETGFAAHSGCDWRNPGFAQEGSHPVVCVSWNDAKAYADWLARKTGKPYRLPSEAEFEYAVRADTTTPFWWGSSITPAQANYDGNYVYAGGGSKGVYRQGTVPAGSFDANPWGLYNVHGNAWQWTEDCWHNNYSGAPADGSAWTWTAGDCGYGHVARGGAWGTAPRYIRAAYRIRHNNTYSGSGFRLARTLTP
jgi:formylglycine-generating enzyme required for sulfatase activity